LDQKKRCYARKRDSATAESYSPPSLAFDALHHPTPSAVSQVNYLDDSATMEDNRTTEYVTLVSNDGYEFKLLRSAACIAGTIKKALDPMCNEPCQPFFNPNTLLTRLNSRIQRKHAKSC